MIAQHALGVNPHHLLFVRKHLLLLGLGVLLFFEAAGQSADDLGLQGRCVVPPSQSEQAAPVAGDEQVEDVGEVLGQGLLLLVLVDHLVENAVDLPDAVLRGCGDLGHHDLLVCLGVFRGWLPRHLVRACQWR